MSKIKLLSKLDLAVIEKNNGKKRCQAVFTPMPKMSNIMRVRS